jgi:hypothetical protein
MPMLRPGRVVKIVLIVGVLLWAYQYGFVGRFEATQTPLTVSQLAFPERTFHYSSPFFFQAGQPASLFVASAPPDALPPGVKVWQIVSVLSGVRAVEAEAAAVAAYRPIPNDLAPADNGSLAPCTTGSGKDLGGSVIPSGGMQIQMRFLGVHFRKPVLVLFSMEGAGSGLRMVDVYFGKRTIDVCRGKAVAASFSQRLWNVPDMAYLSAEHRLLLITGDAALSNAILATKY